MQLSDLFRRKPIGGEPDSLHRTMGLLQLVMLGIGATIGTGIFVALTTAVPEAGPAVTVAFVLAGITAGLTALCYAELASIIPASGSAYSYTYATLGEFVAFIVGSCLLLEYAVSTSAIAVGWGQYLNELLFDVGGWRMPDAIAQPPGAGGVVNLPAVFLVLMCAVLLLRGAKESMLVNAILVAAKLAVLVFFIVMAFTAFSAENLRPFAPLGVAGIGAAASSIFFSYIGIDTVSTAAEEVKDPERNLPLGIVLSLVIVTGVYILVALAAVGAQPWEQFEGQDAGLAVILRNITGASWPSLVLCLGAIASIFSITLVTIYGQTRILYAMSRDGLMPKVMQKLDSQGAPRINTIVVAVTIATLAALVPLDVLVNLTSMGTLIAFGIVSAAVLILRRTRPDLQRKYKVPLYPLLPVASVLFCLYLIRNLPWDTYLLFGLWIAVACVFYFSYGFRHSKLAKARQAKV